LSIYGCRAIIRHLFFSQHYLTYQADLTRTSGTDAKPRPLAATKMTTLKLIRFVKYFTLLTFLISSVFVALIYFSPTRDLVDYSVLYGVVFGGLTVVLLGIVGYKILRQRASRSRLVKAFLLLFANLIIAIAYYFIWDYAQGTILVKIVNNTGQDVTDTGIYGCSQQNWGTLKNGATRAVRFPGNVSCMFIVTYKLNGVVKHEALQGKYLTTNIYQLGTNPDIEVEE
jgi:protein-S-isoprenylcysteine O-methyltransferase Ste14